MTATRNTKPEQVKAPGNQRRVPEHSTNRAPLGVRPRQFVATNSEARVRHWAKG